MQNSVIKHINSSSEINSINYLNQTIEIKKKNFEKYDGQFDDVFNGYDKIQLSRKGVFDNFDASLEMGMLSAIAWGFQKGTRPGGKTLHPFLENFSDIANVLKRIMAEGLNEVSFNELNVHKNVKNGVTTKLLYFSKSIVNNSHCLIYDSRVKAYLEEFRPIEFNKTLTVMKKWQAQPTFDLYKNYCEEAQVCAEQNALSSAAIEMFMFTAAPGKRPAQHIIK
ncbi:hypothetical protein OAV15_02815 [Amylibacter sp.]|nr:hypothetical protein [Amylibacter sp.]